MKRDIILSGVGGQGILSIAAVIGRAALEDGLHIKQAEVHGMSQRGGDVQSNLRISSSAIRSDLIPRGAADLIVSMEPMEALRYLPFLHEGGFIVTSTTPFRNIEPYPEEAVRAAFDSRERVIALDLDAITRANAIPQSANVVLLGAAAGVIGILSPEQIEQSIRNIFAAKGEKVVEMNLKAFEIGREYGSRQ